MFRKNVSQFAHGGKLDKKSTVNNVSATICLQDLTPEHLRAFLDDFIYLCRHLRSWAYKNGR